MYIITHENNLNDKKGTKLLGWMRYENGTFKLGIDLLLLSKKRF